MKQQNKRPPIVFQIGAILLCLMCISSHMTGKLYARYFCSGDASSSARVAKFEVGNDFATQMTDLTFNGWKPGANKTVTVTIENKSEVTICCIVKVENLTKNLPIKEYTSSAETVQIGENTTISITLEWPQGKNDVSYAGKADVLRITLSVEQVD